MNRSDIVRTAYQRFNDRDFEGVLDLCDPQIEFRDLLSDDGTAFGREAVRRRWRERFSDASASVTIGNLAEVGDAVIASVCYQAYTPAGVPIGPPFLAADRFSFRGNRILRVDATKLTNVPDEVAALFEAASPSVPSL
jgi:ketosteroid isomerase-like protein